MDINNNNNIRNINNILLHTTEEEMTTG